jgi:hypothetical protein
VTEVDGLWKVRRLGGLLPPLLGMRKRIHGGRGETLLGPVRLPYEVRGNELHYHRPMRGFVDVLEVVDHDLVNGRATYRGKEFGRFELRRVEAGRDV